MLYSHQLLLLQLHLPRLVVYQLNAMTLREYGWSQNVFRMPMARFLQLH